MAISPNQGTAGGNAFGDTGGSSAGASATGNTYTSDTDIGTETRARELATQARDKAKQMAEPYAERARSSIEDKMARAASELGTVANALRQCGSDMNTRENAMLLPYVEQAADQVDRLSSFLENRRIDDLARDAEAFARRNPAVFLGAMFGVGILAARFLKARPDPYAARLTDSGYNTNYNTSSGYSAGTNSSRGYQTSDNRSASSDGGWVAYGEATYVERDTGLSAGSSLNATRADSSAGQTSGSDRAGYDAQRPDVNRDSTVNGGGASYSGGFRGTEASTDRTVNDGGSTGTNTNR